MTKAQLITEFASLTAIYQDIPIAFEAIQTAAQKFKRVEFETIQAKNAKARARVQQEVSLDR